MKKNILLITLLLILLSGCKTSMTTTTTKPTKTFKSTTTTTTKELKKEGVVDIVRFPEGVELYDELEVFVEDTKLELFKTKVINYHRSYQSLNHRTDSGVGYFFLDGKTNITIKGDDLESVTIRPLDYNIKPKVIDNTATFLIESSGTYIIEPNDDPKKAVFLFVSDIEKETINDNSERIIRFDRGIHTKDTSEYINDKNEIILYSNTTVIVEAGAIVRGIFKADNQSNIKILGTGIIDGSTFIRDENKGLKSVPIEFNNCSNFVIKDVSILDPAGWVVNLYFAKGGFIDNIKIISSRANGDGITIQSSENIYVTNSFVRSFDDSLVVKNYPRWNDKSIEGTTRNINFENIIIWTDLAQSMEIGYETVGEVMEDISFKNITVVHNFHKPVMSIHNGNNAKIKNVLYENITVEDASMGLGDASNNNQLCEFVNVFNNLWSVNHKITSLGSIDSVTVKNVSVIDGNIAIPIKVSGCNDTRIEYHNSVHEVTNVNLYNIWIKGKNIDDSYRYITVGPHSELNVYKGDTEIRVKINRSKSVEELNQYTDYSIVTIK